MLNRLANFQPSHRTIDKYIDAILTDRDNLAGHLLIRKPNPMPDACGIRQPHHRNEVAGQSLDAPYAAYNRMARHDGSHQTKTS